MLRKEILNLDILSLFLLSGSDMKLTILITTAMLLIPSLSSARTWTSADGAKSFEGELKNFDASSGKVTIISGKKALIFSQDKLSSDDREFLKNWKPTTDHAETLANQKVGKVMTKKVLSRLDGKRFKKTEMVKAPEYYLLYFSASW